jgi:hypothetical protein
MLLLSILPVALNVPFVGSFVAPRRQRQLRRTCFLWTQTEASSSSLDTLVTATAKRRRKSSLLKRRSSDKWEKMVAQLEHFYTRHGHSLVSSEQNPELARWCKTIRCNYRHQLTGTTKGSQPMLSEEKLQVLAELKFVWNVQTFQWNQRFREACSFRARHGHFHVPLKEDLGIWIHNQKCNYRALLQGKPSQLTPDRLAALTSIGFFDAFQSNTDVWNQRYRELREFYTAVGHSNVPEDYAENYQLGQWVMNQRLAYKTFVAGLQSPLTPERIALLEGLDFRWNLQAHHWFSMLQRLSSYAVEHGHVRIPTKDTENADLRLWLIQQRHAHRRRQQGRESSMTDQREEALMSVPHFEWKTNRASGPKLEDWDELFAGIREKGIVPGMRPKQHWFEGQSRFADDVKDIYTDDDLLDLWNQEDDEE